MMQQQPELGIQAFLQERKNSNSDGFEYSGTLGMTTESLRPGSRSHPMKIHGYNSGLMTYFCIPIRDHQSNSCLLAAVL